MVELALIAGVARTGAIGDGETIPWYYEADEKQYKDRVSGHPVVVGRKTHEGMSRIEGTHPVVLTRSPPANGESGVSYVSSVPEAVEAVAAHDDRGYVIGGQSVYSLCLPYADRAFVSELPEYENGSRACSRISAPVGIWSTATPTTSSTSSSTNRRRRDRPRPPGSNPAAIIRH